MFLRDGAGLEGEQGGLDAAGDLGGGFGAEDIDFAANAEFGEVDAGFDGEEGAGDDGAVVVGLVVVHIGAVAVDLLADGVAGAVEEVLVEGAFFEEAAAGIVDFEAVELPALTGGGLDAADGGVAGAGDGGKDVEHGVGRIGAAEAGPGDVVVDGAGGFVLGPEVDQEEVAGEDGGMAAGGGLVVGIGGVGVDGDDGAVIGEEVFRFKRGEDEVFDVEFGEGGGGSEGGGDAGEGGGEDVVHLALGELVGEVLVLGEAGFEPLDEVGGGADFDAAGADEFGGAGIDVGDVGDGAEGGVLHGDGLEAGEEAGEGLALLEPAGVGALLAREGIEDAGLDLVDEGDGLAVGGDEVVPAAGDGLGGLEAEDAVGEGIAAVVVEEEPGVEVFGAEGGLDFGDAHIHGYFIAVEM